MSQGWHHVSKGNIQVSRASLCSWSLASPQCARLHTSSILSSRNTYFIVSVALHMHPSSHSSSYIHRCAIPYQDTQTFAHANPLVPTAVVFLVYLILHFIVNFSSLFCAGETALSRHFPFFCLPSPAGTFLSFDRAPCPTVTTKHIRSNTTVTLLPAAC
jgi:hypothetical protein